MDPAETDGKATNEAPPASKKPYHRPQILYRETLEVVAAVCTPSPPAKANPGACPVGPISS